MDLTKMSPSGPDHDAMHGPHDNAVHRRDFALKEAISAEVPDLADFAFSEFRLAASLSACDPLRVEAGRVSITTGACAVPEPRLVRRSELASTHHASRVFQWAPPAAGRMVASNCFECEARS